LDRPTISVLEITLLLGTPLLSLIGSVGIALTVGLRKGGVLLSLIVLPLMIPVLIFATSAVTSAALGMEVDVQIDLLLALLMLALTVVPPATAFGLRISLS
jgi:heme exporter protein B